jgi:hypothetical protein
MFNSSGDVLINDTAITSQSVNQITAIQVDTEVIAINWVVSNKNELSTIIYCGNETLFAAC